MRYLGIKLSMGLALALGLLLGSATAEAGSKKLLGTWQLMRIEVGGKVRRPPPEITIKMTFKKDKTWKGTMRVGQKVKTQTGTWTLKGDKLTTVTPKKRETVTVSFTGAHLELTKPNNKGKAVFKRL